MMSAHAKNQEEVERAFKALPLPANPDGYDVTCVAVNHPVVGYGYLEGPGLLHHQRPCLIMGLDTTDALVRLCHFTPTWNLVPADGVALVSVRLGAPGLDLVWGFAPPMGMTLGDLLLLGRTRRASLPLGTLAETLEERVANFTEGLREGAAIPRDTVTGFWLARWLARWRAERSS